MRHSPDMRRRIKLLHRPLHRCAAVCRPRLVKRPGSGQPSNVRVRKAQTGPAFFAVAVAPRLSGVGEQGRLPATTEQGKNALQQMESFHATRRVSRLPEQLPCMARFLLALALTAVRPPRQPHGRVPACSQVTNLIEDAQGGKPIKGPSGPGSSSTPLSPTTAHAIFSSSNVVSGGRGHLESLRLCPWPLHDDGAPNSQPSARRTWKGHLGLLQGRASSLPGPSVVTARQSTHGPPPSNSRALHRSRPCRR